MTHITGLVVELMLWWLGLQREEYGLSRCHKWLGGRLLLVVEYCVGTNGCSYQMLMAGGSGGLFMYEV